MEYLNGTGPVKRLLDKALSNMHNIFEYNAIQIQEKNFHRIACIGRSHYIVYDVYYHLLSEMMLCSNMLARNKSFYKVKPLMAHYVNTTYLAFCR